MAIFQIQGKDAVLRLNHYAAINAAQNFNWDPAMNEEYMSQLGDPNYDAQSITPEVSGSFELRATGATVAFLKRMIVQRDAGTGEFLGFMAGDTPDNAGLIRETDLEYAVFQLIESKRANEVFDRSTLLPRAHLSSLAMSASADGSASETYNFEGDLVEVFRKPYHDLIALPVTRNTGGDPDTELVVPAGYTVEAAGAADPGADWTIYALDIDGNRVMANGLTVVPAVDRGNDPDIVKLNSGEVPLGAVTFLILYRKTPGAFPTIVAPTSARFVKADAINIWLVDRNDIDIAAQLASAVDLNTINFSDADLFLRAQSCEFNVDMRREALREIRKNNRGNPVYYRAATYPLNITCDLTVFETDLNDWAKIQGKNLMGASAPDILNLADFEGKEWQIVMRYYKGNSVLQTTALLNGRVRGRGSSVQVEGRSEVTWGFTGSEFAIQGSNV